MSLLAELLKTKQASQNETPDDERLEELVDEVNETSEDLDDIVAVNETLTDAVVALESLVISLEANPDLTETAKCLVVDRANRILTRIGADELVLISMEDEAQDTGGLKNAIVERIKKIALAAKNSGAKVIDEMTGFWKKIGNSAEAAGKRAAQLQEMLKESPANDFEFTLPGKFEPVVRPTQLTSVLKADTDRIFNEYGRGLQDAMTQLKAGNEAVFRFKSIQPSEKLPGDPHFVPVGSVAKLEWDTYEPKNDDVRIVVTKGDLDAALSDVRSIMGMILKFKDVLRTFPKDYNQVVENLGNADDADAAKETRQQLDAVARIMNYTVKRWTTYAGTQATLVLKVSSTALQQKRTPDDREGKPTEE